MGEGIVIFNATAAQKSGTFFVGKRPRQFRGNRSLGIFFLGLSFVGLALFLLPIMKAEMSYRINSFQRHNLVKQNNQFKSKFSLILSPDENHFELIIPKMGIKTQVLANVDPANETEYGKILKDNAAHAMGSNLPGEGGLVYIFGHSTNSPLDLLHFDPVFYLLKELKVDDEIAIIHLGKVYFYKVGGKKVINADDLAEIKQDSNQEKLILQTCWPPGTTWKRLLVIAYPEKET